MRGWLKMWMLLPVCLAVLAGGQIWLSHLRNALSLETQQLAAQKKTIRQESSQLGLELASLSRPERLREYAITTLGMAPPKPMQVIRK